MSALNQNTGDNPNAVATNPNTIGALTRRALFTLCRSPNISPERPFASG
jgi:hypothetical protein